VGVVVAAVVVRGVLVLAVAVSGSSTWCVGTCRGSEWWRRANEGQPASVKETKLKSRLRQLNLREGLCRLRSLQCADTDGWVTGMANTCSCYHHIFSESNNSSQW